MADPFSVAGSAIGVVSLGITACKGLIWYIDSAADAEEKATYISARLDSLTDTLEVLQRVVDNLDPSISASATVSAIIVCATAIDNIRNKLGMSNTGQEDHTRIRSHLRGVRFRLSYPFKQGEITYLRSLLRDVQQELHTVLLTLQLYVDEEKN